MPLAGTITIIDSADKALNKAVAVALQDFEKRFCYYHIGLSTLREQMLPEKVSDAPLYLPALFSAMIAVARLSAHILTDLVITPEVYEAIQPYIADLDVIWVAINREQTRYKADVVVKDDLNAEAIAKEIMAYEQSRSQYTHTSTRWVPEALPVKAAQKPGQIILLNGPSSAGKSTLLNAFQKESAEVFLNIGLDTAIKAYSHLRYFPGIPEKTMTNWQKDDLHSDPYYRLGSTWIKPGPSDYNPYPHLRFRIGAEARRVLSAMYTSMAAIARNGFNVIADHCFHLPDMLLEAQHYLVGLPVTYIKLNPSIEVLCQREKQRGDRMIGVAEAINRQMFDDYQPALTFDTAKVSTEDAVQEMIKLIQNKGGYCAKAGF